MNVTTPCLHFQIPMWKSNMLTQEYYLFIAAPCHQGKKWLACAANNWTADKLNHTSALFTNYLLYTCMYIPLRWAKHFSRKLQEQLEFSKIHYSLAYCYNDVVSYIFCEKLRKRGFSVRRKKNCNIFIRCLTFMYSILSQNSGCHISMTLVVWLSFVTTAVGKWSRTYWPNAYIVSIDTVFGCRTLLPATSLHFFTDGSHVYCYNGANYDYYYHDTKRAYGLSRRPVVLARLGRVFGAVLGFYQRLRVVVYRYLLPWCSSSRVFI